MTFPINPYHYYERGQHELRYKEAARLEQYTSAFGEGDQPQVENSSSADTRHTPEKRRRFRRFAVHLHFVIIVGVKANCGGCKATRR